MGKVLLFYKYIDLENPQDVVNAQRTICTSLGLTGRILVAAEGINGTVGGSIESIEKYKEYMQSHNLFFDIDLKESPGNAQCFPKLAVKLKKEIVHLGIDPQKLKAKDGGIHLSPEQTHKLLEKSPEDLVILDGRNNYESRIGYFNSAVRPDIDNFRDFPEFIDKNLDLFKDKQVLMYCTGGIRCERASAYLKSKNITKNVYQISGGIHRYVEQYPDGFFRGKNYVFDGRVSLEVNNDVLSNCMICKISYDEYTNCVNAQCNKQLITCSECTRNSNNTCSVQCAQLIESNMVNVRKLPTKVVSISINN